MVNQQLLDFIKQQLEKGVSKDIISRQLIDNGWMEEDVKQGFGAISTSVTTPNISTGSVSSFTLKSKSHFGRLIFLTVLVLFLLGGSASAYFFRNEIIKLPVIKDFFVNKNEVVNEIPITPVVQINQEQNLPISIVETNTEQKPQTPTLLAANSVINCLNNKDCFIKAANDCQKSEFDFILKNQKTPIFDIGTIDLKTNYLIEGKDKNNCVVNVRNDEYVLKYSADQVASLLKEGKTQIEIDQMENEASKYIVGSGQICKLDLSKKMGDVINKSLFDTANTQVDCTSSGSGSFCTYATGLICESFAKMNENKSCGLSLGVSSLEMANGVSMSVTASGFNGLENKISWSVKDKKVATVSPTTGKKTTVKLISNIGATELIVTDNSTANCSISVPIKVLSQ